MVLSASKGSSDWVKGTMDIVSSLGTTTRLSTNTCIGRIRETMYNPTKGYKPGFGKVNPIIHYTVEAQNPEGKVDIYRVVNGQMTLLRTCSGQLASIVQSVSSPNFLGTVPIEGAALDHLARAVSRSRDAKAQMLVTLGELPETVGMLRDPFLKLAHRGRQFQKLLPRNARRTLSAITNAWLQVRYGVLPLISEVETYRSLVESKFEVDLTPLLKARAGSSSSTTTSKSFVRASGGGYFRGSEDTVLSTRFHATNYYRVANSFQRAYGLDVAGVLGAAWELIPYSFVIDWFADIGGWIQRVVPNSSVQDLANCLSSSNESKAECKVTGASFAATVSAQYPVTGVSNTYTCIRRSYIRNVNLTLPALPQVRWGVKSLKRILDSVSLLHQQAQRSFLIRG